MNTRFRTFIAGAVGMLAAFGLAELIHGLYAPVPSVLMAIAQRVIEFTPGEFATRAIETLGMADIPILLAVVTLGSLAIAGYLADFSRRSPLLALVGVGILAAVALAAAFAEPSAALVPTVLTVIGALGIGCAVAGLLMGASGLRTPGATQPAGPPAPEGETVMEGVRSKEAHSKRGISVGRRGFLLLSGGAAVAGLAAAGAGRLISGEGLRETVSTAPSALPDLSASAGSQTLPPPAAVASIDVAGMPPLITPAEDFYLIDTALTAPRIDVNNWALSVKGTDNPIELS